MCGKPVMLKRGMNATIEEYILASEYILDGGNDQVILCERGIRSFETLYRNTMDLNAVPMLKKLSHLPVIVDPSHCTRDMKKVVHDSIIETVAREGVELLALAVCSNHAHVVIGPLGRPIEDFVAVCKTAGRRALHSRGLEGKVWTRGYDRRFCFDRKALEQRVAYVREHED